MTTTLLSLLYPASATLYATQGDTVREALSRLGYPGYLVPTLVAVKLLGVAAIFSRVSVALSDLAYAGMFFHLLLAISAHVNGGNPGGAAPASVGFALLIVSFFTQNAARDSIALRAISGELMRQNPE
jgi:hypothetical protein